MKVITSHIFKALLFLSIGLFLIWLALRNLTPDDRITIRLAFHEANYFWIVFSMFLSVISHWSRAVRWKILLKPTGFQPKTNTTFFAVMIGYLANFALPRMGEFSRCGVLTKYEKVPFTVAFGTVVTERIVDTICLLLVFIITIAIEFNEIYDLMNTQLLAPIRLKLSNLNLPIVFIFVSLLLILLILVFYIYKRFLRATISKKAKDIFLGFWEGLKSIRKIETPISFFAHTLLIWILYVATLYFCFFSFKELTHLGIGASLSVLIFGSIGIIVVPGGTGAYQALVTSVLTTCYNVNFATAFAFSWIVWTSSLAVILILGLLSLILLPLLYKNKL